MKLYHHHKSLTSLLLIILLPLLLCLLLSGTPTIAQEACVRSCTQNSGINQCRGDIPHDQVAWDALTAPVHDCYCLASVKFTGCRPNCTLEGLPSNIVGRIMGVWEFVDPVCKEAVEGLSKAVESKVISTGSPEYTVLLAESFHTALSSSVAATETVTATGTGTPGGGNVNATGSSLVTPPPTVMSSPTPPSTSESPPAQGGDDANGEGQTRTIAISVSLSASFFLAVAFVFWSWARRKRLVLSHQESPENGLPGGPGIVTEDPKTQGIKRWVAEQERIKQLGVKMDPDTASETTSTAYTLWTDTDLAPTEAGDRERELPPIREEDGESLATKVAPKGRAPV